MTLSFPTRRASDRFDHAAQRRPSVRPHGLDRSLEMLPAHILEIDVDPLRESVFHGLGPVAAGLVVDRLVDARDFRQPLALLRSEEHTSELQSLMRISYAVFVLNQKNNVSAS